MYVWNKVVASQAKSVIVLGLCLFVMLWSVSVGITACGPKAGSPDGRTETSDDAGEKKEAASSEASKDSTSQAKEIAGTQVVMNTEGNWKTEKTFFDFPYPSDVRLNAEGGPDSTGFPNPEENVQIKSIVNIVGKRKGFPVTPVAYFRFSEAVTKGDLNKVIAGSKDASVMLIDIDQSSKKWGTLYPVVAVQLLPGTYVVKNTLAVSVYPGVVLEPKRKYAFVVMQSYQDANGKLLGIPLVLNQLKMGETPQGSMGQKLQTLYQPLWKTLEKIGVESKGVAAATVFTTGETVAEMEKISLALKKKYKPEITDLKLDPDDGDHPRFCELLGKIVQPQFQKGIPPFNKEGLFVFDKDGVPIKQREKELPVVITIPKKPMPADGYPLMMYVHGSGGLSSQGVDRGKQTAPGGPNKKGEGPAHVVAAFGVGTVTTAMPVNPERVKGASAIAYINIQNLAAFRDLFRQGVIEARILLDAMLRLRIDPKVLASCKGATLPKGETHYRFSNKRLTLMGQSMGAMYTNMIGAVEPRFRAVLPTGAGGFWSFFVFHSNVSLLKEPLVRSLMQSREVLTYVHPAMHMFQTAIEGSEPLVYIPHLARRPLPGHEPRHIFQPVGQSDSYFKEAVLDVLALAYGNQQAGKEIWPELQKRLKVMGRDGFAKYPIKLNRTSEGGKKFTGVVAQYVPDTISKSGHYVAFQLDEVIHQYSCFLKTFVETGVAVVPAPSKLGTPCPTK